ncbi:MAG: autotransporter outer membrane beta-barrel domain-containing protein [Alphaproteobacteria bacterium]|nr:autotransporter outer membrane beta-barrel domain-containing protein [Alphaproteobacteria bacterium]
MHVQDGTSRADNHGGRHRLAASWLGVLFLSTASCAIAGLSSGAVAQSLTANGTTETASGTYNAGTATALRALNNGTITSSSPLTVSSSSDSGAVQAESGGRITIGSSSLPGSTVDAGGGSGFYVSGSSSRITMWSTDAFFSGSGIGAYAVDVASAGASAVINGGTLKSTSALSGASLYVSGGSISTTSTIISDVGARYGAYAETGGVLNLTGGSFSNNTGGAACAISSCIGVYLLSYTSGSVSTLNADNVAISTAGADRGAVRLSGYTAANFTGGSVTTTGDGSVGLYVVGMSMWPADANGMITATGTVISTSGTDAYGAYVNGGITTLKGVEIQTRGAGGIGVVAGNGTSGSWEVIGTINLENTSVITTGASATGVYAWAGGVVNISGGSVTTSGDGAIALRSGYTDGITAAKLDASAVQVTTSGQGSPGAYVLGSSSLKLSNGTVIDAKGEGSAALYASMTVANSVTVQDSMLRSEQSVGVFVTTYVARSASEVTTQSIYVDDATAMTQTVDRGAVRGPAAFTLALNNSTLEGAAAAWSVVGGNVLNVNADASRISGASLIDALSEANVTLQNGTQWQITGDSRVTNLTNDASTVGFAAPLDRTPSSFRTLAVANDYVGKGGTLRFNTVLEGDGAATDRMVVGGTTSGASKIVVTNAGGGGALTTGNGIQLIEVTNGAPASTGTFALANRVAAGAYQYLLLKGGQGADADDGNWYLHSQLNCALPNAAGLLECGGGGGGGSRVALYRPEVVVDTAIAALASRFGLGMLGSFDERRGGQLGAGAGTTSDLQQAIWGRLFGDTGSTGMGFNGSVGERSAAFDQHGPSYSFSFGGIQAGIDLMRRENADGSQDVAGFHVGAGSARADVAAVIDFGNGGQAGRVSMDAASFGGYYSHIGAHGWYVDAALQATRYTNIQATSNSDEPQTLKAGGTGVVVSLEGGYPVALGHGFVLEPQAQLVYQHLGFGDGADKFGQIAFSDSDAVYGRVSGRLSRNWLLEEGRALTAWARASLWSDFGAQAHTTFSNLQGQNQVTLGSDLGGRWAAFAVGISAPIRRNVALFTVADYNVSVTETAGHSWGGRAGVTVFW